MVSPCKENLRLYDSVYGLQAGGEKQADRDFYDPADQDRDDV